MSSQQEIKQSFVRMENALIRKPALGRQTYSSNTRITGLNCSIEESSCHLNVDLPLFSGEKNNAPTPGVLGRAALGSCLAIGYMLWASRMDIEITSLEVEVQADSDDAGLFGTADTTPGYAEVRYCVKVRSPASEEEILSMLDAGDAHSPWLDIFKRPISCTREVQLST